MTKPPTRQHEMIFGQSEIMVPPEIEESGDVTRPDASGDVSDEARGDRQ